METIPKLFTDFSLFSAVMSSFISWFVSGWVGRHHEFFCAGLPAAVRAAARALERRTPERRQRDDSREPPRCNVLVPSANRCHRFCCTGTFEGLQRLSARCRYSRWDHRAPRNQDGNRMRATTGRWSDARWAAGVSCALISTSLTPEV